MANPRPLLELRITGPRPGTISVPDLIRICQAAQNAVTRQAEAMKGGSSLRPGPKSAVVYEECTLELTGIKKGSTILPFTLVKPQQALPEQMTMGKDAVLHVTDVVRAFGSRSKKAVNAEPGLLDSLREMGEVLDRGVITKIEWIVPRSGKKPVKAVFDRRVRDRVIERIKMPTNREETIEGTLEMADFKESDHKCRIHPPLGQPTICTFTLDQEQMIYDALRKPVRITGTATINPNNDKIESIAIEQIEIVDQLFFGEKDFHRGRSIEELAEAQGVSPLDNPKVLSGGFPEDEDVDQFLEEIYSSRLTQ